jgi:hypothetical protein
MHVHVHTISISLSKVISPFNDLKFFHNDCSHVTFNLTFQCHAEIGLYCGI